MPRPAAPSATLPAPNRADGPAPAPGVGAGLRARCHLGLEALRGLKRRWRYPGYPESSDPFVSVDLWRECASVVVQEHLPAWQLHRQVERAVRPVVFIPSWLVPFYVDQLARIRRPFHLITASNDDPCVPFDTVPWPEDDYHARIRHLLDHSPLAGWHTKNPACRHPKIHPLPLGPKWQWSNTRFCGEPKRALKAHYGAVGLEPAQRFEDPTGLKTEWLYCGFSDTTTAPFWQANTGLRARLRRELEGRFSWAQSEALPQYLATLARHRFALSPAGRGIDTHRTWEALLVGTIPIVQSSPLDPLFRDLPVLIVEAWDHLTPEFLRAQYARIRSRAYDFSPCFAPYWRDRFQRLGTTPTPAG